MKPTYEQLLALLAESNRRGREWEAAAHRPLIPLSPQEMRVLACFRESPSYQKASEKLGISIDTVRTHVRRMYAKLGVHSAVEALAKVYPQSDEVLVHAVDNPGHDTKENREHGAILPATVGHDGAYREFGSS